MYILRNKNDNSIVEFANLQGDDWLDITNLPEGAEYLLNNAKIAKISQLKLNRDNANTADMVSHQAFELKQIGRYEFVETANLVYFAFQTKDTGQPATQPDTIVQNAIISDQPMRYSCKIIEGDQIRKGYVSFDRLVAISIRDHALLRNTHNITECNNIEIDINSCTTLEEVEAINITF